jgi:hypothetical protein
MSRQFDGSADYLEKAAAPVTAYPWTLACDFRATTFGGYFISIAASSSGSHYFGLGSNGDTTIKTFVRGGAGQQDAATVNTATANTWHKAVGRGRSSTDRDAVLDGDLANKGTNTSNQTPSSLDRVSIARVGDSTPGNYFDGRIEWAAVWDVALSDAEVTAHSKGVPVWKIRPVSIKGLWPVWGISDPETDLSSGGNALTVTSAPPFAVGGPTRPYDLGFAVGPVPDITPDTITMPIFAEYHRRIREE